MSAVADNLARIEARMVAACERARRDRGDVTLVAVSKRQPVAAVREARDLGVAVFAENYAQALVERMGAVPDVAWDFVGHVQSNKARYLVPGVRLIHSLSTRSGAEALSRRAVAAGGTDRAAVLVEVDTSPPDGRKGEPGARTGAGEPDAARLAAWAAELPGLDLRGLMALPPPAADPEDSRSHFRRVRALRDRLADDLGRALPDLSMGMSRDYEVAIEEGATLVRIGEALFGARPPGAGGAR